MLKKTLLTLVAVTVLSASARADLLAHWGFDTFTGTSPEPATTGIQAATANLSVGSTAATVSGGTGTIVNDPRGPGNAGNSLNYAGTATALNGSSFTIHFSGTSYDSFTVTYAGHVDSGSGPRQLTWEWSTDGVTFSQVGVTQPGVLGVTYAGSGVSTADFAAVTGLNNQANVFIKATLGSATGGAHTLDVDNIQVNAVPEPINVALALFGLSFVALRFGRRLFASAQK